MLIFRHFTFDAAHYLPNVPAGHKCKEIHGHTYKLTIYIEGQPNKDMGWIIDFAEVKQRMEPIIGSVDHKFLNKIEGLENPTCELLTIWLWNKIIAVIPNLSRIELNETPTSGAIYSGK